MSAVENVALPPMLLGAARGRVQEHAREWLTALGLGGLQDRRPGELSAGQARRVAVARALITAPAAPERLGERRGRRLQFRA